MGYTTFNPKQNLEGLFIVMYVVAAETVLVLIYKACRHTSSTVSPFEGGQTEKQNVFLKAISNHF
jgi:hypothetical protein